MARYVIEHDHEVAVPEDIDIGQFVFWAEHYPELENDEHKKEFIRQYASLEKAAKNVTARTLVATRIHGRGFGHAAFGTSVGQYLLFLGAITIGFVVLLITHVPS